MTAARAWIVRQKCALGLLIIVAVAYPVAWNLDLYIFGFTVLGLVWFQCGLAAIGMIGRIAHRETRWLPNAATWVVDVLLMVSGVGALMFLRTVSWS